MSTRPIVTEGMAADYRKIEHEMCLRNGTRCIDDMREALSEWLAKHFPAGEEGAVELTQEQADTLYESLYRSVHGQEPDIVTRHFADFGLRIVRVKPEAAKVEAATDNPRDAKIAELAKRIDALELGYRDAKSTNAEIQDDVDDLTRRLAALEARKPETAEKSAGRVFSEAEVRAAIKADGEYKAAQWIAERLGIDLEGK